MAREEEKTEKMWAIAARTIGVASAWIAGPVLVGLFLGKWLDRKFATSPLMLIICLGTCFLISMFGIVNNALKEFKKIEADAEREKLKE